MPGQRGKAAQNLLYQQETAPIVIMMSTGAFDLPHGF